MKVNKTILATICSIALTGVLCVCAIQVPQNKAISLEETINSAYADVEAQEKRRVDLVYNLVDTVQAYDKHEAETLKEVVKYRAEGSRNIEDVNTVISAITESYPELKSNENYKQLMKELSITENMIMEYRATYNTQIKNYNSYVRKFPTRLFLSLTGYVIVDKQYLEFEAPSDAPQNLFD